VVPSFGNASIFLEILFIQCFAIFGCKQYDVITDLVCMVEERQCLETKKDISGGGTPFFCVLTGLSGGRGLFFMSYALLKLKALC